MRESGEILKVEVVVVTDRDFDAIVTGAGIGGLVCGSLLARRGLNVAIVEKNLRPGGYVGGFIRAGYYFDAGVQAFSFYNILPEVLAELDLDQSIVFRDSTYRIVGPKFDVALTGIDYIGEQLQQAFPESAGQLKAFFDHVSILMKKLQELMQHPHPFVVNGTKRAAALAGLAGHLAFLAEMHGLSKVYARDFVRQYLGRTKAGTFLGEFGWYKGASAVIWLLMLYAFIHDYRYPAGGMQQLVDLLATRFQEAGGKLISGRAVTAVTVSSGVVTGVRAGAEQLTAGTVVYNGDLKRLGRELVAGQWLPDRWQATLRSAPVSETNVSVYVATDYKAEDLLGIMRCNHLIYSRGWKNPEPGDPAYFSKAQVEITCHGSDSFCGSASAGTGLVLQCAAPWRWQEDWAHYRGEEYQQLKAAVAEHIIHQAAEAIPGLENRLVFYETATPRTNEHYTLSHHGATGGFSWDWQKSITPKIFGHYRTPVKNLYLAGQWTFLPGGVPAAVLAGKRVADIITGQAGFRVKAKNTST